MKLCDLKIGSSSFIQNINLDNSSKIRLNELGITKGTKITKMLNNNGINAYYFKNTLIAIRNKDASNIIIGDIND